MRSFKLLILSLVFILAATGIAMAGGLSSHFIEVKLKDVKIGKIYSVQEKTGKLLDISNTTEDMTLDIAIESEKPQDYNLVSGYEPIPDLSWVVIEKNFFEGLKPGETVKTDILISIPKKGKYAGKKYQVYIYSHTTGEQTFRTGLMGRLLIEINKKKK